VLRHCARGVVNSISKSTSALLPRHLLLEIQVNLYKWRAVQCSYTVTEVTVSFSFNPTVLDRKKRGDEIKIREAAHRDREAPSLKILYRVSKIEHPSFETINSTTRKKAQSYRYFIILQNL